MRWDQVVIGGGLAGLVAARLLPGRTVVLEPTPARHRPGESVVPEQFRHPELAACLPEIRALPSYAPKHGVTFVSPDAVATFPLSVADVPAAMHVARDELDALLLERWKPTLRRESVVAVDLQARHVTTAQGEYEAGLIVDASGAAMVVARAAGLVRDLDPVTATWAYYDVASDDPEAWRDGWSDRRLRRFDARRKRLLESPPASAWSPAQGTVLSMLEPGTWCWQIPLFAGTRMSVGLVRRGAAGIATEALDAVALGRLRPGLRLTPRAREGEGAYDRVHTRQGFARVAARATGEGFVLLGDAFAFADPIYSVGTGIAVNQAVALAEAIGARGWTPPVRVAFEARSQALLRRSRRAFGFWYSGQLLHDDAAATEVQRGFLVGEAFAATTAETYGDALASATLREGEHAEDVQVPEEDDLLEATNALLTAPAGWSLADARRCTDGVRTRWRMQGGDELIVYALRDPACARPGFGRGHAVTLAHEGHVGQAAAPLRRLLDQLAAQTERWAVLLTREGQAASERRSGAAAADPDAAGA